MIGLIADGIATRRICRFRVVPLLTNLSDFESDWSVCSFHFDEFPIVPAPSVATAMPRAASKGKSYQSDDGSGRINALSDRVHDRADRIVISAGMSEPLHAGADTDAVVGPVQRARQAP